MAGALHRAEREFYSSISYRTYSLNSECSTFVYRDELWSGIGFSVDIEKIAYSSYEGAISDLSMQVKIVNASNGKIRAVSGTLRPYIKTCNK